MKTAHFLDADEEIVNPSTLALNQNHIMIFDDVMLKDQTQVKDYFCRARHNNVNVFYLCQSLNKIANIVLERMQTCFFCLKRIK